MKHRLMRPFRKGGFDVVHARGPAWFRFGVPPRPICLSGGFWLSVSTFEDPVFSVPRDSSFTDAGIDFVLDHDAELLKRLEDA
jgi:hypothetical protein